MSEVSEPEPSPAETAGAAAELAQSSPSPTAIEPIALPALSVLLLAHNEGTEVEEAAVAWQEFLQGLNRPFEVILVDDGGNDAAAIDRLAQQFGSIRVIRHVASHGLGASLRAGMAEAQHPLIFYTLCNKQYCPADLNKLLEQITDAQVVTGCRISGAAPWWLRIAGFFHRLFCRVVFGLPVERRVSWLGWSALGQRLIARWLFGLRFHDPASTFCLFRREVFRRIPIQSDGSFAPVEILAKANFLVTSGAEVPVSFVPRRAKPSFVQEAMQVLRDPDFGPAMLPEPEPPSNEPPPSITAEEPTLALTPASQVEIPHEAADKIQ